MLGEFRQQGRFVAAALQLGLRLLPRGDIPRDRGRPGQLAGPVPQGRDGEGHREARAVPGDALGLIMVNGFPTPEPCQELRGDRRAGRPGSGG